MWGSVSLPKNQSVASGSQRPHLTRTLRAVFVVSATASAAKAPESVLRELRQVLMDPARHLARPLDHHLATRPRMVAPLAVDGCDIRFAPLGNRGSNHNVGSYRGIESLLGGAKWNSSIHSMANGGTKRTGQVPLKTMLLTVTQWGPRFSQRQQNLFPVHSVRLQRLLCNRPNMLQILQTLRKEMLENDSTE